MFAEKAKWDDGTHTSPLPTSHIDGLLAADLKAVKFKRYDRI